MLPSGLVIVFWIYSTFLFAPLSSHSAIAIFALCVAMREMISGVLVGELITATFCHFLTFSQRDTSISEMIPPREVNIDPYSSESIVPG